MCDQAIWGGKLKRGSWGNECRALETGRKADYGRNFRRSETLSGLLSVVQDGPGTSRERGRNQGKNPAVKKEVEALKRNR